MISKVGKLYIRFGKPANIRLGLKGEPEQRKGKILTRVFWFKGRLFALPANIRLGLEREIFFSLFDEN